MRSVAVIPLLRDNLLYRVLYNFILQVILSNLDKKRDCLREVRYRIVISFKQIFKFKTTRL